MPIYYCTSCHAEFDEPVKFCTNCYDFTDILLKPRRAANEIWSSDSPLITSRELRSICRNKVKSESYPNMLLSPKSLVAIYGGPGQGKTTFMIKFLDGLDGPVVLLSIEEGVGDKLSGLFDRLEITREDFYIAGGASLDVVEEYFCRVSPVAIGIDSLSMSTLIVSDLIRISEKHNCIVCFTLHATKTEQASGPMKVLHGADLIVEISALQYKLEKSRFCPLVSGNVLA